VVVENRISKEYHLVNIGARRDFIPIRAKLPNILFLTFRRAGGTIILNSFDLFLSLFDGPLADLYLINNLLTQLKVSAAPILSPLGCKIFTTK
jgi:hypothetical protein